MDKRESNIDPRFDLFIKNKMTPEQTKEFQLELKNNEALKRSFEFHRDAIIAIKSYNQDKLRSKIRNVINNNNQPNEKSNLKRRVLPMRFTYLAAASLIMVIGVYQFLIPSNSVYNFDESYSSILKLELDKNSRLGFAKQDETKVFSQLLLSLDQDNKLEFEKSKIELFGSLSGQQKEKLQLLEELKTVVNVNEEDEFNPRSIEFSENEELYQIISNISNLKTRATRNNAVKYFEKLSQNENSEFAAIAKEIIK